MPNYPYEDPNYFTNRAAGGMMPGGAPSAGGMNFNTGIAPMAGPGGMMPGASGLSSSLAEYPGQGGGGIGGWWGGLEGADQAQLILAALGTGANIYGQHQAGKARDREYEENQRRYDESVADRDMRRDQRAALLGAFVPTRNPEAEDYEERTRRRRGPPPRAANPNFL